MSESFVCPMEDPLPPGGPARGRLLLVAKAVLDLSIAGAALLVNLFVLWAVVPGTVRRRLGRPSRMLVISLVTADALSGLMLFQYHLSQNVCPLAHWVSQRPAACLAKFVSVVFVGMASINSLAAIAYDRYLCIVHSLRYQRLMTTRRAWLLIAVVWAVSAVGSCALLVANRWRPPETPCVDAALLREGLLLQVVVPMNAANLVMIAVAHLYIRGEVGRSEAMLPVVVEGGTASGGGGRAGRLLSVDSLSSASTSTASSARGRALVGRRLSAGTIKSAQVLLLVVGCYVLAFTPVLVIMLLRLAGVGSEQVMEWAFRFGYSVAGLHNVVNPFIYSWKNKALKADLLRLWASLWRRKSAPPPPPPPGR